MRKYAFFVIVFLNLLPLETNCCLTEQYVELLNTNMQIQ